jgi:putative tricarboxylic transport membrane protein
MLEALLDAFLVLLTGWHPVFLAIGVVLGIAVGIFPGLGGTAGMALLIPFIFGMDPISALAMMTGLLAVIATSDTFASVMMGIPGSSSSQATVLDGFPLAKDGQAARALSAAFSASLIGGLFGALILTGFILIARPIVLAFGAAELFMLALLGLSMVSVLSGASMAKGMAACGVGLILGAVGPAPATGEMRLVFDTIYLSENIPLVVVALAAFAVPEIIDLLRQDRAIAQRTHLGSGWMRGIRDMIRNKWIVLRCSAIGAVVGTIPGLGGSVVDWIAYGHVVQTSRDREMFSKGDIRGVIGPESANNAKEGGALVPTLLFAVPGSGGTAVFLGGMILIGIQPGVTMIETRLDVVYTIIWSLALANVIGAGLCILIARPIAKLTEIPYVYVGPLMIMVIFFAAFQSTRNWGDILALVVIGIFATYMKRFGWPRPALLIGFVLANSVETYLYQAVQFHGWSWLQRPVVLVIAAITVASIYMGWRFQKSHSAPASVPVRRRALIPQILFCAFVFGLFAFTLIDAMDLLFLGKVFPLGVAVVMLLFSGVVLTRLVLAKPAAAVVFDSETEAGHDGRPRPVASIEHYLLWIIGLVATIALVGFVLAVALFLVVFLAVKSKATPLRIFTLTASAVAFLAFLSHMLVLRFPDGLLQALVSMPWPLD